MRLYSQKNQLDFPDNSAEFPVEEESNQSESQSQFVQDFSTSDDTNNTETAVEGSWLN